MSGKAGVLFRVNADRQRLRLVRHVGDAARQGELRAERAAEQPEQPECRAAEVHQLRGRAAKWDLGGGRLSLTGAVFHTENENVIFTVDATAVPPIYNQDDGQLVNGVTLGAMGRITDRWEVLANFGYLDTRAARRRTPPTTASA